MFPSNGSTVAKKRLAGYHNINFMNADIRSAGLPDDSFDVIVISHVLHDIPQKDRRPIVSELAKKLRSGGFVQLREPTRSRHGMPVEEIRSLMSENGLKEEFSKVEKNRFQARYVKS